MIPLINMKGTNIMRNTKWVYAAQKNLENRFLNLNPDILNILSGRGISEDRAIYDFLHPSLENLGDPFGLKDVEKGVERIQKAIASKETIWIYGDYDVDGITSTALCYLALKELGAEVRYYIPLRDEGYGLNCDALSQIASEGGKFVITVDCGITSHKECDHAKALGIDILITDHHDIIDGKLPSAYGTINPKRDDNSYSFKYLAGVGTAFMLLYALYITSGKKEKIYEYLDIVAIGTVADIVSLRGDNRIFVKYGLERLRISKSDGLRALLRALFFEDHETRIYSPYDIGFIIAPVFNAAGRLEDAKNSVELLISKDNTKYSKMIDELISNNQRRKEIQEEILNKVIEKIELNALEQKSVILVADEEFHHGVIGIVASKILDRYYKPTIILEIDRESGIAKASCRSTEAFNMIEGLTKFSDYLLKFGGHHGAAGFSISVEKLPEFYEKFEEYCSSLLNENDRLKPIKISEIISAYKIGYDLMDNLKLLEPYGFDNPTPIFSIMDARIKDLRTIGKEHNHISFTLLKNGVELKNCVWWNSGDLFDTLLEKSVSTLDIAFKLKLESFRERFQYKVYVEDIKPSGEISFGKNSASSDLQEELDQIVFPIKSVVYSKKMPVDSHGKIKFSEDLGIVYQHRDTLGYLDSGTTQLLKKYSSLHNLNFSVKIDQVKETMENYNIFISIFKDYNFKSYAIKDSQLFSEIKEFLIGKNEYSPLQKEILKTLFRENNSYEMKGKFTKEIETVATTIALFHYIKKLKVIIITDEPIPEILNYYCDSSHELKEGYDFYIFIKKESELKKFKFSPEFSSDREKQIFSVS